MTFSSSTTTQTLSEEPDYTFPWQTLSAFNRIVSGRLVDQLSENKTKALVYSNCQLPWYKDSHVTDFKLSIEFNNSLQNFWLFSISSKPVLLTPAQHCCVCVCVRAWSAISLFAHTFGLLLYSLLGCCLLWWCSYLIIYLDHRYKS